MFKHSGYLVNKTSAGVWTAENETRFLYSFNLDTIFKLIDNETIKKS